MRRSILVAIATATTALALSAPAGASTLFAPHYGSEDSVHVFNSDANGALSSLAGSPFLTPAGGMISWAMTSDGLHGFGTYLGPGAGGVRAFNIAENGSVTAAQDKISWAGNQGTSMAVSPDNRFLFVATRYYPGSGAAGIRVYSIAAAGTLTEVAGSPFNTSNDYWDVAVTADGSALYAMRGSSIDRMAIAADGTLGAATPNPTGSIGPISISLAPDGRFLFLSGTDSGMSAFASFAIGAGGGLTQVGTTLKFGAGTPNQASLSANGRFLYVADENAASIFTAAIAPDGSLSLVGSGVAVTTPSVPTISPDGRTLYVSQTGSAGQMAWLPVGADGAPTAIAGSIPYDEGEWMMKVFRPGQGTIAKVTAKPDAKPLTMRFDSSGTTALRGTVASRSFEFGDATSATQAAPVVLHKFAKPGVYNLKFSATDDNGCATALVYLGRNALCRGAASSATTLRVDTPPWIKSLKVSPSKVSSRTKIKFTLTEAATVTFAVQKPTTGRTVNGSCKKQTAKNKKFKKCTRWITVGKKFTAKGKVKKTNSVKFTGSVKGRKLPKGSYRFSATAKDKAKGVGPAVTAKFKIKS